MTVIELSQTPPSTNNLFFNVGKRRAITPEYKSWRMTSGIELMAQKPEPLSGRVGIDIAVADKGRGDIDNKCKAAIDLLVEHGVIEGDSRKYVRDVRIYWSDETAGCRIEIWKAS